MKSKLFVVTSFLAVLPSLAVAGYADRVANDASMAAEPLVGRSDRGFSADMSSRSSASAAQSRYAGLPEWINHVTTERQRQSISIDNARLQIERDYGGGSPMDNIKRNKALADLALIAKDYDRENNELLVKPVENLQTAYEAALKQFTSKMSEAEQQLGSDDALRLIADRCLSDGSWSESKKSQRKIKEGLKDFASYIAGEGAEDFPRRDNVGEVLSNIRTLFVDPTDDFDQCCKKMAKTETVGSSLDCNSIQTLVSDSFTEFRKQMQAAVKAAGWPMLSTDLAKHGIAKTARVHEKYSGDIARGLSTGRNLSERLYNDEQNSCINSVMEKQRKTHATAQWTQAALFSLNSVACAFVLAKGGDWSQEDATLGYTVMKANIDIPLQEGRSFRFGCTPAQVQAVEQADQQARAANMMAFQKLKQNPFINSLRHLPNMTAIAASDTPVINLPDGYGGSAYMIPNYGFLGGAPSASGSWYGNSVSTGSSAGVLAAGTSSTSSTGRASAALAARNPANTNVTLNAASDQGLQLGRALGLAVRQTSAALAQNPRPKEALALASQVSQANKTVQTILGNGSLQSPTQKRALAATSANTARNLALNASAATTSAADVRDFYERVAQTNAGNALLNSTASVSNTQANNAATFAAAQAAGQEWISRRTKYAQEAEALKKQIDDALFKKDTDIDDRAMAVATAGRTKQLNALLDATKNDGNNMRELALLYSQWQLKSQAVFDANQQLKALTLVNVNNPATPSRNNGGSRAQAIETRLLPALLQKFFWRTEFIPEAQAANSNMWGSFGTGEAWRKAWDAFVVQTGQNVKSKEIAARRAERQLHKEVEKYQNSITEENMTDRNVETLIAMDMFLHTADEETGDLLEKFRVQKDKNAIEGNVLNLIRQAKDDVGAAQDALGQILKQRLESRPTNYLQSEETWWAYAQSVDAGI